MAIRSDRLRAPIFVVEGVDVVPPSVDSVIVVGTVANESGTQPKGPHPDVDASAP